MFCSPLTPCILSYTINFLTGGTGQKELTCLSVLVVQMWPSFSPGTRSDHVYRSCFYTGLWVCFMSVLSCFTFTHIMFIHVIHCQTKVFSFSKLETSTHCFWFLWVISHSKSTFPQSNFKIVWWPCLRKYFYFLKALF